MAPSVLPQFNDPTAPQSVAVTNFPTQAVELESSKNTAFQDTAVILPTSGGAVRLRSFFGYNKGPAGWLHIKDKNGILTNGDAPNIIVPLYANSTFSVDVPADGLIFALGLAYGFSTTETTTTVGSTDLLVTAMFKR